jgi:hypothetical protein
MDAPDAVLLRHPFDAMDDVVVSACLYPGQRAAVGVEGGGHLGV